MDFLLKILDVSENGVYCYSSVKHILLLLSFMSQPKWFMAAQHTRSQLTMQYKNRPFTLGVQNRGRGSVTVPRTKRTNETKKLNRFSCSHDRSKSSMTVCGTISSLEDINVIDPELIACCEDEEDESILIFA
jgi:hypothetical protein